MPAKTFPQGPEFRLQMTSDVLVTLQHLAWRAIHHLKMSSSEFVILCIAVDTRWRSLVIEMTPQVPESYYESYRELGKMPLATFTGKVQVLNNLALEFPDTADKINAPPMEGMAKCVTLDDEGYSLYEIKPVEFKRPHLH